MMQSCCHLCLLGLRPSLLSSFGYSMLIWDTSPLLSHRMRKFTPVAVACFLQKQYYRAIFERNRAFLMKGAGGMGVANLNFIEMELRKCCNHPFLLRGVEERETAHMRSHADRMQRLINCSGKLVLLAKLLPKLKAEGHKVAHCL